MNKGVVTVSPEDENFYYVSTILSKEETELPAIVVVPFCCDVRDKPPRIYFQNSKADKFTNDGYVAMSISNTPKIISHNEVKIAPDEVAQIREWIRLNKSLLLRHWENKINSAKLCFRQKRIE